MSRSPEAQAALADAAQLLAPDDAAFIRAEMLARVTTLANKLSAMSERPRRRRSVNVRDEMADITKLARKLCRKLWQLGDDETRALNEWHMLAKWPPRRLAALADELDQLSEYVGKAAQNHEFKRHGRGTRPGVTGTLMGWLARECANLVERQNLPIAISRDGILARVAALIWQAGTGQIAPDTLADKSKVAARLVRDMAKPSAQEVIDETTDRRRGHDLEAALDAL